MSALEAEIEALRCALDDLAERVRADAVADEFLAGVIEWRVGDCFIECGQLHRIGNISSEGKWTCGGTEARPSYWSGARRLYTREEVTAAITKVVNK